MFDGVDSPLTQTFGLGMFSELQASSLDVIEQFFVSRSSTVYHEVSPLADPATMGMLNERGYRPIEQSSVMHRPLPADLQPTHADLHVRQIDASEIAMWANTSAVANHVSLGVSTSSKAARAAVGSFCQPLPSHTR